MRSSPIKCSQNADVKSEACKLVTQFLLMVLVVVTLPAYSYSQVGKLSATALEFNVHAGFSGYANPLPFYAFNFNVFGGPPTISTSFNDLSLTPLTISVRNPLPVNVPFEVVIRNHSTPLDPVRDEPERWIPIVPRGSGVEEPAPLDVRANSKNEEEREDLPLKEPQGTAESKEVNLQPLRRWLSTSSDLAGPFQSESVRREYLIARRDSEEMFSLPLALFPGDKDRRSVGFSLQVLVDGEVVFEKRLTLKLLNSEWFYSLLLAEKENPEIIPSSKFISVANQSTGMRFRPTAINTGIVTAVPTYLGTNPQVFRHFQFVLIESKFWSSLSESERELLEEAVAYGVQLVIFGASQSVNFDGLTLNPERAFDWKDYGYGSVSILELNLADTTHLVNEGIYEAYNRAYALYFEDLDIFPPTSAESVLRGLVGQDLIALPGASMLANVDIRYLPVLVFWFSKYLLSPSFYQPLESRNLGWERTSYREVSRGLLRGLASDELPSLPSLIVDQLHIPAVKHVARPMIFFTLLAVLVTLIFGLTQRYGVLLFGVFLVSAFGATSGFLALEDVPLKDGGLLQIRYLRGSYASSWVEEHGLLTFFSGRRQSRDFEISGSDVELKRIAPLVNTSVTTVEHQQAKTVIKNIQIEPSLPTQLTYRARNRGAIGLEFSFEQDATGGMLVRETLGDTVDRLFIVSNRRLLDLGTILPAGEAYVSFPVETGAPEMRIGKLEFSTAVVDSFRAFEIEKLLVHLQGSQNRLELLTRANVGNVILNELLVKLLTIGTGTYAVGFRKNSGNELEANSGNINLQVDFFLYRLK